LAIHNALWFFWYSALLVVHARNEDGDLLKRVQIELVVVAD